MQVFHSFLLPQIYLKFYIVKWKYILYIFKIIFTLYIFIKYKL